MTLLINVFLVFRENQSPSWRKRIGDNSRSVLHFIELDSDFKNKFVAVFDSPSKPFFAVFRVNKQLRFN